MTHRGSNVKVAKLFRNGGSQAVRLPAEFRFEGDEVYVTRNEETGDVILSMQRRPDSDAWQQFIADRDAHPVPQEELDEFTRIMDEIVADRQNHPISTRGVFDDIAEIDEE